jgi:diaminopimelate decarboxylase
MHIGSGVDYPHLAQVAQSMTDLIARLDRNIEAFSLGGGLATPYTSTDKPVDINLYARIWAAAREKIEAILGHAVRMEIEPGRFLLAESGYLVTEVRAVKKAGGNTFILVDAGFNDLMRPALYGSYHRMTLLDVDGLPVSGPLQPTLVAGPLCEAGDVFTQSEHALAPQDLPQARVGDLLVIHDTGAYGASMSSNYNSRPLLPELLIENQSYRMIRRRQTVQELLNLELCP